MYQRGIRGAITVDSNSIEEIKENILVKGNNKKKN